jgi:hypothetical protein
MTGQEQYDLFTQLLGGETIDTDYFLVLLNASKSLRENARPWRKLIREDTANSASPSDTYLTMRDLPATFRRSLPRRTLFLEANSSQTEYEEILFEQRGDYRDSPGYFYIDHFNSQYGICGQIAQASTIRLFFVSASPEITLATSWIFPAEFHKGIVFDAAAMHQLGADYDDVNARKGNANAVLGERIASSMAIWDAELQRSALRL